MSNRARDECRGVKWLQVSLDGAAQVLMTENDLETIPSTPIAPWISRKAETHLDIPAAAKEAEPPVSITIPKLDVQVLAPISLLQKTSTPVVEVQSTETRKESTPKRFDFSFQLVKRVVAPLRPVSLAVSHVLFTLFIYLPLLLALMLLSRTILAVLPMLEHDVDAPRPLHDIDDSASDDSSEAPATPLDDYYFIDLPLDDLKNLTLYD